MRKLRGFVNLARQHWIISTGVVLVTIASTAGLVIYQHSENVAAERIAAEQLERESAEKEAAEEKKKADQKAKADAEKKATEEAEAAEQQESSQTTIQQAQYTATATTPANTATTTQPTQTVADDCTAKRADLGELQAFVAQRDKMHAKYNSMSESDFIAWLSSITDKPASYFTANGITAISWAGMGMQLQAMVRDKFYNDYPQCKAS